MTSRGGRMRRFIAGAALLVAMPAGLARAEDEPVTFRGSFRWLTSYRHSEPAESVVHPENATLRIPTHTGANELRPNLKLQGGPLQLIFRPRVLVTRHEIQVDGEKEPTRGETTDQINEAYVQWSVAESLTFA